MSERRPAGDVRLPIVTLALSEQRYSCHGCGNCCRDFSVQLRPDDLERLRRQHWEAKLGMPVTVEFRGQTYLRQRPDGACVFWLEDGRCRIHAEFGFEEKPIACQLFPFSIVPGPRDAVAAVNFSCGSVLANRGAALSSHHRELLRMSLRAPESTERPVPILLAEGLIAEEGEIEALTTALDRWLRRGEIPLAIRLDGLAWIAQSLMAAKLENVRGSRFRELVDVLVGALPDELAHLPIEPPHARQRKLFRQAVAARTEDHKLGDTGGRWRTTLAQLLRSRRFARGRGAAEVRGPEWTSATAIEAAERCGSVGDSPEREALDELVVRHARATLLGRRAWGAGYYGWPVARGLAALVLNVASVGWLARLRAGAAGRVAPTLEDLRAALSRIDRASGRAPWLGSAGEALRLRYLAEGDGLRRLVAWSYRATSST